MEFTEDNIHKDPDFQRKKDEFFQNFMVRHLAQAREFKRYGLLNEEGAERWRNVAKHQLLSAVTTETMLELLGISGNHAKWLVNESLTHDVDKRRQQESQSKEEVIEEELLDKTKRPLVATTSNFTDSSNWGIDEYILRYVDSSVGDDPKHATAGRWYGGRDSSALPRVMLLPWRQRVQMFKDNKQEEGERGVPVYGMTTWEKLEQIMTIIEADLYTRIIQNNPDLAERYTDPSQLTQLIEDRIHEKILSS